jgi:hypothetical protein
MRPTIAIGPLFRCIIIAFMALSAGPGHAQVTAPTGGGAKKPICGLVTMGLIGKLLDGRPVDNLAEINAHPGVYAAAVLNYSWRQLEPAPGQFDFAAIDADLVGLRAYNAAHPDRPVAAKLRVTGGILAPAWVEQSAGTVTLNLKSHSVVIGRFWTPVYRQDWRALQTALAAAYDNNPLLREVAISSCATVTDEPFNLPHGPLNDAQLQAAGFTDAADQACLTGALDDYAAWHATALDYTFNPFVDTQDGHPRPDPAFTTGLMEAFRARFGARAVLANHGLEASVTPRQADIYAELAQLGPPIAFQTFSPKQDFDATWRNGVAYHPTEFEMWVTKEAGGAATASAAMLQDWASELPCGR